MEALAESSWRELAELVGVIRLEEKYQVDHAQAWFRRRAEGPLEARQRFADGLATALAEAVAAFEPPPEEEEIASEGVLPGSSEGLLARWLEQPGEALAAVSPDYVLEHHRAGGGGIVPTSK